MTYFRLQPDPRRLHPVERFHGNRLHHNRRPGHHRHLLHHGRLYPTQQHPGRQGIHARALLRDPGGHVPLPRLHIPLAGQTHPHGLLPHQDHAWSKLRHDVRLAGHQDQPHREDTRRKQEEDHHQEAVVHERNGSGCHHLVADIRRVQHHRCHAGAGARRFDVLVPVSG